MKRLQNTIDRTTTALASVLFAIVVVILAYNVFARFLGGGIKWYMEASQYLNVWALLVAGIGITAKGEHLRISALESFIKSPAVKRVLQVLVSLLTIAFYLLLAYGTFLLASKSKQNISTMGTLKMAYIYWPLPVISLLSAASATLHMVIQQTEKQEEKEGSAAA